MQPTEREKLTHEFDHTNPHDNLVGIDNGALLKVSSERDLLPRFGLAHLSPSGNICARHSTCFAHLGITTKRILDDQIANHLLESRKLNGH